ncbi:S-adenosyl-L-methionine-dependent methyltransferase [Syncephalis fuscata]|nr:S-adenosyl-L-methionine-dependent methyltransferase [Syncephalis fuscata]
MIISLEQVHVLIRGVLKQNYIAPLDEPKQVLDVGCGTGIWMLEMAEEFPDCEFTGIDISNVLRTDTLPANCIFKLGNALERLRFKDNSFDYVHQLQFGLGVPKRHWPRLCREYKRILRPDGWMEFAETDGRYFRTGPAGNLINNWLKEMYAARGVEPRRCCLLPEILADAGFPVVLRRIYSFPLGQWGKRLGQSALVDAQVTLQSLWPRIREVETQLTKEEFDQAVMVDWPSEVDEHKTYFNLRVYWCQKD